MSHIDLERLVCAGAVDKAFRELLLRDPLLAAEGYHADRFSLTMEEKALIANIHAGDYKTFVLVITDWILKKRASHLMRQGMSVDPSSFLQEAFG